MEHDTTELMDPLTRAESPLPLKFQPLYNTSDKAREWAFDSKVIAKSMFRLLLQVKELIRGKPSPKKYEEVPVDFDGGCPCEYPLS
jgi:hypothetical protein